MIEQELLHGHGEGKVFHFPCHCRYPCRCRYTCPCPCLCPCPPFNTNGRHTDAVGGGAAVGTLGEEGGREGLVGRAEVGEMQGVRAVREMRR
jgi:hypothetical protein